MDYEDLPPLTRAHVAAALARDEPEELSQIVLSVALHEPDRNHAETLCLSLAAHPNPNVRGNAVLGLGHLARLHGSLDMKRVRPVVTAALTDENPYVRSQAEAAADDIAHFLKEPIIP